MNISSLNLHIYDVMDQVPSRLSKDSPFSIQHTMSTDGSLMILIY